MTSSSVGGKNFLIPFRVSVLLLLLLLLLGKEFLLPPFKFFAYPIKEFLLPLKSSMISRFALYLLKIRLFFVSEVLITRSDSTSFFSIEIIVGFVDFVISQRYESDPSKELSPSCEKPNITA